MLFSSGFFLGFFLPLTILVYWILPNSFRNLFLLAASLFFYAWGEPKFVFLLASVTLLNFFLALGMERSEQPRKWLFGYIFVNLALLVVFKYSLFLWATVCSVFGIHNAFLSDYETYTIPLGISFYAFHAITYGVDVYRKQVVAERRIDNFGLYLFLFPHQIAGPIVPFGKIAPEIRKRVFSVDNSLQGLHRFTIGLGKKVILSNGLFLLVEVCQSQQQIEPSTSFAWIEMLAYTFHIYFDFSGYSDMAIGLGLLFGFHFPENFNRPYSSKSITEFWKRWHISLGYFMKNYLYIPLGGNRNGSNRLYVNLILVFFLSGLWHGASWNFVIWGLFHGFWLVIERLFLSNWLKKTGFGAVIWTFILVLNGWVFFHKSSLNDAIETLYSMWSLNFEALPILNHSSYFLGIMLICFALILSENNSFFQRIRSFWVNSTRLEIRVLSFIWMALIFTLSYSYVVAGSYNPFIYFNF